jgi:acetyltransferase-like isoleucine patch superfamily enzyme
LITRLVRKIKRKIYSIAENNSTTIVNTVNRSNLSIGSFSTVTNCHFGNYNRVNNGSYLDNTSFGDFTYSGKNATIINCRIGKFCSIAQNVSIGLGIHPIGQFVSTHPAFYSTHKQCGATFADRQYFEEMGSVDIGNDVWIGANSIILDNVTVGDGAVIAANSVVTNDVPPYSIVGGSPARLIKFRFSEADIAFLREYKWWDKDVNWLRENLTLFHDIRNLNRP